MPPWEFDAEGARRVGGTRSDNQLGLPHSATSGLDVAENVSGHRTPDDAGSAGGAVAGEKGATQQAVGDGGLVGQQALVPLVLGGSAGADHDRITTGILLFVLLVFPHGFALGRHSQDHWRAAVVEVAVWAVIATVVHGLMHRIRDQSRDLAASEQRYRSLFIHNPEGVFSLDRQGRFTTMNAAGARLLGLSPEQIIGSSFHPFVTADELPAVEERFGATLAEGAQTYEMTVVDVRGRHIPAEVTNVPIAVEGEIVGVHGIVRDLSENKALMERLEHQSLHDPLTGLANRSLLGNRLNHALKNTQRTPEPVAVLMLDLDEFKDINDIHGHHTGDALLVEVATRMAACIRPGDTAARLGGDEFALVLPEADQHVAVQVAQRLLEAVSTPVVVDSAHLRLGASIGIAISPPDLEDGDHLLRDADQAMYAAKRRGRGRFVVFNPSTNIAGDMPADRPCGGSPDSSGISPSVPYRSPIIP